MAENEMGFYSYSYARPPFYDEYTMQAWRERGLRSFRSPRDCTSYCVPWLGGHFSSRMYGNPSAAGAPTRLLNASHHVITTRTTIVAK